MRVHTSIATTASFAHPRHRGHRVPNQYSARHPDDLKTLGLRHDVVVRNGECRQSLWRATAVR